MRHFLICVSTSIKLSHTKRKILEKKIAALSATLLNTYISFLFFVKLKMSDLVEKAPAEREEEENPTGAEDDNAPAPVEKNCL
jgi:hypothetical protein